MTTVYDVPAEPLINKAAEELRSIDEIEEPEWAPFTRTGGHREKPPASDGWWFTRCAALLRKVYLEGPIGTERIAAHFGGKRDRGAAPGHAVKGSRNIVRTGLQQLEAASLLEKNQDGRGGRKISPEGQRFLDGISNDVKEDLVDEIPELAKY